ncbi:MAG: hypothetical protein KGN01_08120 [Patescibacteria group bacterium]|nr:hypothetical protein [Patescibacteria group bacterium]
MKVENHKLHIEICDGEVNAYLICNADDDAECKVWRCGYCRNRSDTKFECDCSVPSVRRVCKRQAESSGKLYEYEKDVEVHLIADYEIVYGEFVVEKWEVSEKLCAE